MLTRSKKMIAAVLGCLWVVPAFGQVDLSYYMPQDVSYNSDIPKPADYLGFQPGEWHLRHDLLAGYMHLLAEKSDRITIEEYGRTYENRQLLLLTITSPENQQNIDDLQAAHVRLSDPESSSSSNIDEMPAVVWLGYSVHGNEPSGANSTPLVAYYLAAAQGEKIDDLLNNTIILLDPSINPDGLGRFAHWANSHKSKNLVADPLNREHREAWPGGRTNHYWFDLNRDWLPVQHPESQGRIKKFHEWKPNVLTDHHEMGTNSTFFFMPGIPSRNNPLTPERTFELTAEIAKYHAKALDKIGSLYYARESFDDFYYGKGSTYPDVNGAVAILFEQGSSRGHLQESIHGDLSFPFTIRNQFTASLSTLEAARNLRTDLLQHQRNFYTTAMDEAQSSGLKAYVFGDPHDPARTAAFVKILLTHKIRVHKLGGDLNLNGHNFKADEAFVVPLGQPQHRFIKALFERRTTFQDSLFYDVSAWTLPLAFNIPDAEVLAGNFSANLLGDAVESADTPNGQLFRSDRTYAYAFEWRGYFAPRALYKILKAGLKAKVATRPFEAVTDNGPKKFDYGAIIVPLGIQGEAAEKAHALAQSIAADDGIDVHAVTTGYAQSGIDLGSRNFEMIRKPKVLIVGGSGASGYGVGEAWHLFDQRYDMDVSIIEQSYLNFMDLHDYTTMVMAGGSYRDINKSGVENIERWLRSGNTLITLGGAARWAVNQKLATAEFKSSPSDSGVAKRRYVDAGNDRGAEVIGGAIFETELDLTHPIAYGYTRDKLAVFRRGTMFMKPSKSPYATPLRYTDSPLLAGYSSDANKKAIANTAAVVVSGKGSGRVIMVMDNVNFRAFWYGTNKLFINSVFFGDVISGGTLRGEEH